MLKATRPASLPGKYSPDSASELDFHLPTVNIVSYRGPGNASGMSTGLEPVVSRLHTRVVWLAIDGQPNSASPSTNFTFCTPQVAPAVLEQHAKVCTNYLWPLFHDLPHKAVFDANQWKSFRQLNEIVASETLNVSGNSFPTLCWMHDYQLPLVAPTLSAQAGIIPCHFWHAPWPLPEVLAQSPVGLEIVEAMLNNRLIGFQTTQCATNFLNTVQELVRDSVVDVLRMEIKYGRSTTSLTVLPYGIDSDYWQNLAQHTRSMAHGLTKKYKGEYRLILAIDHLSPNKGVLEKLDGLEEFLVSCPQWQKRFQYLQITYPTDANHSAQSDYPNQVAARIASINSKHGCNDWQPIIHLQGHLSENDLAAWYQAADVLLVNALSEGLSLIAKEFVACRQDDQGVLVLSKKSGSISELGQGAIPVDPSNKQDLARGILQACSMSKEETRRRMQQMQRIVSWNNLQDWAVRFLTQALDG